MSNSKNDIAWKKIFEKYKVLNYIISDGFFIITSSQINEYREARLMTKFDHKSQLPELFSENNLSILPVSRGNYIIGPFETFFDFNTNEIEVSKVKFPTHLKSLDYRDITSEATALNCAYASKILHEFTNEEYLMPTVSGRMSSSSFSFNITTKTNALLEIRVDNAQVEIDGGFEGESSLYLIEAKNYISADFVVRQIFYPYKLWHNKIPKKICPVFLTFSNGVFYLREYAFTDSNHYNSIQLVKHKQYTLHESFINRETIEKLFYKIDIVIEPEVPFPQANSFSRIIDLGEQLCRSKILTKEEVTLNYDFNARQTDYYINAGKYLGLFEIVKRDNQSSCILSAVGKHTFQLPMLERQVEFIKLILRHSVFYKSFMIYWNSGKFPAKKTIIEVLKQAKPYQILSENTFERRASTIKGWISWIIHQIEQ
jgi:hypothetical protein